MMELALRTTVVLGLAFLVAGTLRRATHATRHLLWHVTIAIIVLAPVLQTLTPRIPLPAWLALDGRRAPLSGVLEPHRQADALSTSAVSASQPAGQPTIWVGSTCTDGLLSCLSPTVIWFSGSLLVGAWFAFGWLASVWIAWRAAPRRSRSSARCARSAEIWAGLISKAGSYEDVARRRRFAS